MESWESLVVHVQKFRWWWWVDINSRFRKDFLTNSSSFFPKDLLLDSKFSTSFHFFKGNRKFNKIRILETMYPRSVALCVFIFQVPSILNHWLRSYGSWYGVFSVLDLSISGRSLRALRGFKFFTWASAILDAQHLVCESPYFEWMSTMNTRSKSSLNGRVFTRMIVLIFEP